MPSVEHVLELGEGLDPCLSPGSLCGLIRCLASSSSGLLVLLVLDHRVWMSRFPAAGLSLFNPLLHIRVNDGLSRVDCCISGLGDHLC